ncbi:MAG TPA: HAD family hydrolase [Polyangiaceae bacterium]|nr:HAD family hydrolase [Polyangiaceae bacterium]
MTALPAFAPVAVAFDYGNTLVEFGRRHVDHCDAALGRALRARFGEHDAARFHELREANRLAPYRNGCRENRLPQITRELVVALYGQEPTAGEVDALVAARFDAFVSVIEAEPATLAVLQALRERFRLAVVSNYPCGRSIRASLERVGILPLLDGVVVSGDVGFAKPHPAPFAEACARLGCRPAEVLFVGDNWLADVQGARRAGMTMVHLRRWTPPEHFDPEPDDLPPHATIARLEELLGLTGVRAR